MKGNERESRDGRIKNISEMFTFSFSLSLLLLLTPPPKCLQMCVVLQRQGNGKVGKQGYEMYKGTRDRLGTVDLS